MNEEKKQEPTWQEKFDADTSEFQGLEAPEMPTTGPAAKDGDEEKKGEEPVQTSEAGKESDKKDSAEDPGEPAKKAKVPRSVQKRIDREVKKRKELEEKLKSLESNAKQGENEPEKKEQNDSGPQIENFDTWDEYQAALDKWEKRSKFPETPKPDEKKPEADIPDDVQDAADIVMDSIEDLQDAGVSDFADVYKQALNDGLMITSDMTIALSETENPGRVLYELAKNPSESQRISGLSKYRQAREIFLLEQRAKETKPATPPKKKTSNAPDPIANLNGSSASAKTYLDKDVSFSDFERMRNAEERKSKGW